MNLFLLLLMTTFPDTPVASAPAGRTADPAADSLLTVAERSDFKATARHAEVVALLDRLAAASPLARRGSLGRSVEGRDIPLLILADPPVQTAAEAAQARAGGRLIVLAIGNIHGGEVDGKEALPILARELLAGAGDPLLRELVLVLAPIYNADGNERVAKDNRPGQVGPADGMGIRANADGLDLNRDFIKLEAPETRGLVQFLNTWDPHLFIDTHTTNGSYHRYVLTYEGAKSPASDPRIVAFNRTVMLPAIRELAAQRYRISTFVYGDFMEDHTRWGTFPATGRFGTTYVGLRHRLSILTEGYSYAPYRDRVSATRDFVRASLEYAAAHRDEIRSLLQAVDTDTAQRGRTMDPDDRVAIRSQAIAEPQRAVVAGYEESRAGGKVELGPAKDYSVEMLTAFEGTEFVTRPAGYAIPAEHAAVVEKLRLHGIAVQRLEAPREIEAERYTITQVSSQREPFQRRRVRTLEPGPAVRERITLPAGTFIAWTAQPLGNLLVYLLEPGSEDSLATWDFLGEAVADGAAYPLLRVLSGGE